jgi:hypothetical protein
MVLLPSLSQVVVLRVKMSKHGTNKDEKRHDDKQASLEIGIQSNGLTSEFKLLKKKSDLSYLSKVFPATPAAAT